MIQDNSEIRIISSLHTYNNNIIEEKVVKCIQKFLLSGKPNLKGLFP